MLRAWLAMRTKVGLAYRGDLLFAVLGDAVVALVGLAALGVLFTHAEHIAGFDLADLLMAWGLAQAALGVHGAAFSGLTALNRQYLVRGGLDRVLLRPGNPYLQIMLEHLRPGALAITALGLTAFCWGWMLGGVGSATRLVMVPVFVAGGALLVAGLLTATATLGLWTRHEGSAVGLVSQFAGFAHVPPAVLPRGFAVLVTAVIPFAFAGFVPATWFQGRDEWAWMALAQPALGVVVFTAGYSFWRASLPRYGSVGH